MLREQSIKVRPEDIEFSGTGGGNWTFPTTCTNDCWSVIWEPVLVNGTERVRFDVKGRGAGYVGVYIFNGQLNAERGDCYLCRNDSSPSGERVIINSALCNLVSSPTMIETLPESDVIAGNVFDGEIWCSFYRNISVSKQINGQIINFNITAEMFTLIYAEGNVTATGGFGIPIFSMFSSHPFVLINETLFRSTAIASGNVDTTSTDTAHSNEVTTVHLSRSTTSGSGGTFHGGILFRFVAAAFITVAGTMLTRQT